MQLLIYSSHTDRQTWALWKWRQREVGRDAERERETVSSYSERWKGWRVNTEVRFPDCILPGGLRGEARCKARPGHCGCLSVCPVYLHAAALRRQLLSPVIVPGSLLPLRAVLSGEGGSQLSLCPARVKHMQIHTHHPRTGNGGHHKTLQCMRKWEYWGRRRSSCMQMRGYIHTHTPAIMETRQHMHTKNPLQSIKQ